MTASKTLVVLNIAALGLMTGAVLADERSNESLDTEPYYVYAVPQDSSSYDVEIPVDG